ncbi:hypothetical protein [Photobacterium atrarenae]|uniref:Uncharacterized protein n=1 Tax=Photobacterium atrarenae TaxID=865757 RepID=A0ABY5GE01_9GAMM|nr:hypothetical protein [Photobacterium atrarenae]UTV27411.1 hypothetical protein NNL38_13970 [Photobacterium atrarenae]
MEGYVGFQQELYRLFTDLKYNNPSLQTLRQADKEALELVFKVEEGSSDTSADGWDFLNKLTESLTTITTGMDSMEKLILVLLLSGILGGVFCYYVRNNRKLENEQFLEQQKTTRAALESGEKSVKEVSSLLQNVLSQHPQLNGHHSRVMDYTDQAHTNFMRRVPDASYVRTGSNEYRGAEIREFSRRQRGENGKRNERTDDFYIDGVERATDSEYLVIKTTKVSNESPIRMKALGSIIGDDLEILTAAFVSGEVVTIRYISSVKDGDEYSAQFSYIITDEEQPPQAEQPESA